MDLKRAIVTITIKKDGQNSGFVPADLGILMGEDVSMKTFGKGFSTRQKAGEVPDTAEFDGLYEILDQRMATTYLSENDFKGSIARMKSPEKI